jgi:hypothetical protein
MVTTKEHAFPGRDMMKEDNMHVRSYYGDNAATDWNLDMVSVVEFLKVDCVR